jgi:hypothetical protein
MATSADTADRTGKKWEDMKGGEKLTFVCKLFIALCTFGFVYPNVMIE